MTKNFFKTFNMFIPITNQCNQHCNFCEAYLDKFRNLSLDDFKSVLQNKIEEFKPKNISVNLGGGEPLLNEDLLPIIKYCSEQRESNAEIKKITVFTNGKRLGDDDFFRKFTDFLIDNRIKIEFVISTTIFSPETQRGVRNLLESKYFPRKIYIKAVVSKNFIEGIDQWYENLLPILRANRHKQVIIRFRFINLKYKARINEDLFLTRYDEIMPSLEKHVSFLLQQNMMVQTEFFPWCVWNDKDLYYRHQYTPKIIYDLEEQNGVFTEKCRQCVKKEECNGFTRWTLPDEDKLIFSALEHPV